MAFKKSDIWVEVPQEMMKKFNYDNMLAPFRHRDLFRYYGSAANHGLSKQHVRTSQCYIMYKALVTWNPVAAEILKNCDNML